MFKRKIRETKEQAEQREAFNKVKEFIEGQPYKKEFVSRDAWMWNPEYSVTRCNRTLKVSERSITLEVKEGKHTKRYSLPLSEDGKVSIYEYFKTLEEEKEHKRREEYRLAQEREKRKGLVLLTIDEVDEELNT